MNLAVEVNNLQVAYERNVVLDNVSWQVKRGTLAGIIGPNGGGKSTFLKSLLGMVPITKGTVRVLDQSSRLARPQVAYLPQREEVDWNFPITCFDVVLQGRLVHLKWWQKPSTADYEKARDSLALVGMVDYASRAIGALSGGQKQRVFIARALAQEAKLIIMDEPATGLDAVAQHELLDLFQQLKKEGHTVIVTTHDLNCIAEGFDTVLGLNRQVILSGIPSEVMNADILTELFARHFPVIKSTGEVTVHD